MRIEVTRGKLKGGYRSSAAFSEGGRRIDLVIDVDSLPKTEWVKAIKHALGTLAGAAFVEFDR